MCGVSSRPSGDTFRAAPTDLGFNVTTLRSGVHTLEARNTYWPAPANIVVIEDGDGIALIDCGFGTEEARDGVASALAGLGYDLEDVHTVLITHPHLDHAGGIGYLPSHVRVLGPAMLGTVVADAEASAELIFPSAARALAPARADLSIVEHFRIDCGVASAPVATSTVQAGDVIELGRTRWEVISTPGHEDGMFSYYEANLHILACSDILISKGTSIPWYAPGGGGTVAYLEGLDRLSGLDVDLGIRGHGGPIYGAESAATAVLDTATRIRQRTSKIRTALSAGPLSFADLEDRIYKPRVYEVIPWAASVLATHLLEGLDDGTLRREDDLFTAAALSEVRT